MSMLNTKRTHYRFGLAGALLSSFLIVNPCASNIQIHNIDLELEMERLKVDDVLKNYIIPKIEQCRKNYPSYQVLTLAWTIKSNGVVTDTNIPKNISKDKFVSCVVEVIEDWIFPSFPKEIRVTYEF